MLRAFFGQQLGEFDFRAALAHVQPGAAHVAGLPADAGIGVAPHSLRAVSRGTLDWVVELAPDASKRKAIGSFAARVNSNLPKLEPVLRRVAAQELGHRNAVDALHLARVRRQRARLAGHQRRGERGGGPVGPDRVDRIAIDRDQLAAARGQRLGSSIDPGLAVEPGIIADPRAVGGV